MNIQESLNVLGLSGDVTENEIKKAFKKLAVKYHPDKNPLGAEMMKMINAAKDFLMLHLDKIAGFQSQEPEAYYDYSEEMEKVLNALQALSGVVFEVIGNWVWISGETKEHKETFKELGCRWAFKKKQWFYRPEEHKSTYNRRERSIDEIREMYGTNGARKASGTKAVESRA